MPSIEDIPDHLRTPDQKAAFTEWVLELAIDLHTARSLVHLWSRLTRTRLTSDEWHQLEAKHRSKPNA